MASNNTLIIRYKVAAIIRSERMNKQMSQEELAITSNCSRSTIARIEAGVYSPNADQLYQIFNAIKVDIKINGKKVL